MSFNKSCDRAANFDFFFVGLQKGTSRKRNDGISAYLKGRFLCLDKSYTCEKSRVGNELAIYVSGIRGCGILLGPKL